jgi:hypothetical protein
MRKAEVKVADVAGRGSRFLEQPSSSWGSGCRPIRVVVSATGSDNKYKDECEDKLKSHQ